MNNLELVKKIILAVDKKTNRKTKSDHLIHLFKIKGHDLDMLLIYKNKKWIRWSPSSRLWEAK